MVGQDSSLRRTRPHVSSTSRATIFVLSPPAGMLHRKSLPETSCALHSGDPTIPLQCSTLLTLLSSRRTYKINLLVTAHHITQTVNCASFRPRSLIKLLVQDCRWLHFRPHSTSTGCPDRGTSTPCYGSVLSFLLSDWTSNSAFSSFCCLCHWSLLSSLLHLYRPYTGVEA